jgi:hypothetical protein
MFHIHQTFVSCFMVTSLIVSAHFTLNHVVDVLFVCASLGGITFKTFNHIIYINSLSGRRENQLKVLIIYLSNLQYLLLQLPEDTRRGRLRMNTHLGKQKH